MALIVADRVMESATTTGTGNFSLAGAYSGYRAFDDVMANADTCYYVIEAVDGNGNPSGDWEAGLGTFNDTDTLIRTAVHASTNSNNAVSFAAGTKRVTLQATSTYLALAYRVGGTDVAVADGGTGGSTAADARTNLGLLRLIACFFTSTPTASEVLAIYIAADAFTLAANLSGSQASVGTNPTATFAIDVQKNGSTIATVSISTGGAATLTTVSGTSKAIAVGDIIKLVAPGSADATCANVAVTLKGTL